MRKTGKWPLVALGTLAIVYAVAILAFVATAPDLRLRCLLTDEHSDANAVGGLRIQDTPGIVYIPNRPQAGDFLLKIGDRQIGTFMDFSDELFRLRTAQIGPEGQVPTGTDPIELGDLVPWLVADEDGNRWVRVTFRRQDGTDAKTALLVQSVPLGEVVLTLVWFILQLGIFAVGALAYWNRPFDRPSQLFFAMCIVTMGAFVGGYHWWVIAGRTLMVVPFTICAVMVPVVTLHFFLVYPRPKGLFVRWPRAALAGMYVVPAAAIVGFLAIIAYTRWLHAAGALPETAPAETTERILAALGVLRLGVYSYVSFSGACFLLTVAALVHSVLTTRNPLEHSQVKWILWAALFASIPVSYSLYLAHYDRVGFAIHGRARLPMFLANLSFMLAYTVGILRYRLMLAGQLISKGVRYYLVSFGLTLIFGGLVASGGVVQQLLNTTPSPRQLLVVFAILLLSVLLLVWLRDQLQQVIDRRFFRQKYQLDKALERMNRAASRLVEPTSLAESMLASCCDVLRVEHAAFYLRNSDRGPFELTASQGIERIPLQCAADEAFCEMLQEYGSLQRVPPGEHGELSPAQYVLRGLRAELVVGLEIDGMLAGLVALGPKPNGSPFTAEDLTFLNALGQITNIALHGARVHKDLTRLNEELRMKVEKIESQKRQIALLQAELTSAQENFSSTEREPDRLRRGAIKGNSPAIREVQATVRKGAGTETTVLIRGESGTGKELLAQVLHENSPRAGREIICVHCAALSPGLLESELFGHVKGAFTGAHKDKIGRFEAADGGTLFLDEIGDIPLETQVKLLRVLQERCFEPVGSTRTVHVDVRLITATHQNLERLIAEGRFREDLYYRLNVISIFLPPLRERKEDLIELALHFLNQAAGRVGKRILHIDEDALDALEQYSWPGNIRELQNVIERAVVLAEDSRITLADLPHELAVSRNHRGARLLEARPVRSLQACSAARTRPAPAPEEHLEDDIARLHEEREALLRALQQCGGNKAQAARLLGMPRSTLFSKLRKHALT